LRVEYSPHALEQMAARHITKERVEETLRVGTREPSVKNRQLVRARIEGFELTVIIVEEGGRTIVITVYRTPPWSEE
jgi:hypothetical protein